MATESPGSKFSPQPVRSISKWRVSFFETGVLSRQLTTSLAGNGLARVHTEVGGAGLGGAVGASMKMSILRQSFCAGKRRELILPSRQSTREHAAAQVQSVRSAERARAGDCARGSADSAARSVRCVSLARLQFFHVR